MFPPLGQNFANLNALQNMGGQNLGRPMPVFGSNPPRPVLGGGGFGGPIGGGPWGGTPPSPVGPYPVSPIGPARPVSSAPPVTGTPAYPVSGIPPASGAPLVSGAPALPVGGAPDMQNLQQLMALRQMMQGGPARPMTPQY